MPPWRKKEGQCLLNAFSNLFKANEAVWNFNDFVYEIPSHRVKQTKRIAPWQDLQMFLYRERSAAFERN